MAGTFQLDNAGNGVALPGTNPNRTLDDLRMMYGNDNRWTINDSGAWNSFNDVTYGNTGGSQPAPAPAPQQSAPSSSGGGGGTARPVGNTQLGTPTGVVKSWEQQQAEAAARAAQRGQEAYDGGLNSLREDITYNGFNPDDYTREIERYLGEIRGSIPEGDQSPSQYYAGDIYNPWKTGVEQEQLTGYQNELNKFLSPGFATDMVNSNMGNGHINSILDQQQGDATGAVTRARDRGTLNDQGYDRAISDLSASRAGGYERLDGIRDGLVAGYQDQLRGQADISRDRLNTFTLGDTFDTQGVQDSINSYYDNLKGGFKGEFDNAFGGDKLFDWNKHIQQGGVSQGVTGSNLNAPTFLSGLQDRQDNEDNTRGLGNTGGGVF